MLRVVAWVAWGACASIGNALDNFGDTFIGIADEIADAMERQTKEARRRAKRQKAFERTRMEIESIPETSGA